ncbi:MAG: hypothetical protein E7112_00855 [Bacteroidales bacterium]|nr:hypothetical protein [Bacteroidales bacterium]
MPAPDIQKEVEKAVKELIRLKDRVLPVKVGRAVRDSVRQNFRQGGFYGRPWKVPMRTELGFSGPGYGPMLSGTNHLMMSTDYVPEPGRVTIQNTLVYAQIHNDGGEITVTKRMKKYFWSQYYKRGLVGGMYSQAKGKKNQQKADTFNKEADFWRNMALKKVGSKIKIPKRQFLGEHPEVDRIVTDIINQELLNFAQNHGSFTRRSH